MSNLAKCKLCDVVACVPAGRNKHREFVHCPNCGLVFVPNEFWLSADDERARYAHHDNSPSNEGYVTFLRQVADVVVGLGMVRPRVLDFGSGENAVLAKILRQRGFDCVAYEPLYGESQAATHGRHNIVVLCEVIEHLRDLQTEIQTIKACLAPGGRVVVRTQFYPSVASLTSWWYARDATHINFFSEQALQFTAGLCGLRCQPTTVPDIFVWTGNA
jgi:hypothetical protein